MDITEEQDYIVVGSGCTGAMAAQTLIEKGVKVLMLDGGEQPSEVSPIPDKPFTDIRNTDTDQYKYWLGENFEGISIEKTTTGAQLTPARKYILQQTEKFIPLLSDTFSPMESLSYGGLGNAWGLGCCVFSPKELEAAGLPVTNMQTAYQVIADRIGISAEKDDATLYTASELNNLQKVYNIDSNSSSIYRKYKDHRQEFETSGFHMGKPALALLTESKGDRKTVDYNELDFYTNNGAAYRPSLTIDELRKKQNFQYVSNAVVLSFSNEDDKVVVNYTDSRTNERKSITCKKLILCASTLSTARIVLRSMNMNTRLTLLCNPYKYFTTVRPSMLGMNNNEPRTALAQLAFYYDPDKTNFNVSAASIYSYRSLMLFRAIKELQLNFREGRKIMQYLLPAVSLMGVHHPDSFSDRKYIELVRDSSSATGDKLKANYELTQKERSIIADRDKKYVKALRKLGCYTLKKLDPGYGASIHYAGTLPFNDESKPFTLNKQGRLNGVKNVFVADGSGFKYLPAKGITLSIMAYAHLTALNALTN